MEERVVQTRSFAELVQWTYEAYAPLVWAGLFGYWIIINYGTFLAFKLDKQRAIRGDWRWPEATLLNAAFLGGSVGAKIAQKRFRHKTRKEPFRSTLNTICVLHIITVIAGLIWLLGYWPTITDWGFQLMTRVRN